MPAEESQNFTRQIFSSPKVIRSRCARSMAGCAPAAAATINIMALPVSPRPGEERGTARLGRHGACCLSVRLEHGCGCLAASKAHRQWSRRRKLRLLADPGFHIWFRSPPLAGSPSSPRKISLRLLWVSCSCRGDLRSDSGRCGKPTTCVPDYVKHQFVLGLRGTARVNDD